MVEEQKESMDLSIDKQHLYLEESFTDLHVGSIRRLTPVKTDGTVDKTRKTVFVGQTNIVTPGGPLPIQSVIKAKHLQQAIKRFPEAMQVAVDKLAEEVKRYQEQQNSAIITPSAKEESRIIVPGR